MRLKAVGPYKFLRAIKGSGAEVLTSKGKIIKAAMANLKPYYPPVTGERQVQTQRHVGKDKRPRHLTFDSSSESDWDTEMSDADSESLGT